MFTSDRLYPPAELFLFRITFTVLAIDAMLILLHPAKVAWGSYAVLGLLVMLFLGLGSWYRHSGRSRELGSAITTVGIFILFSNSVSLLNYLLTPNSRPLIDDWLIRMDTLLGYSWPQIIAWAADYPLISQAMRLAYNATLIQVAVLIIALVFTNRIRHLHAFTLSLSISGLIAVIFWAFFPSLGPSAYYQVPKDILLRVHPVVSTEYRATILSHFKHGSSIISPDEIRGMIAFPSMHIVMAGLSLLFSRPMKWLFFPYLAIVIMVIPGVLVHGGHHLVDIPAGLTLMVLALMATGKVMTLGYPVGPGRFAVTPASNT